VPLLSLASPLAAADRRKIYWRHDAHLTPYGHTIVAETLYPFVVREAKDRVPPLVGSATIVGR